MSGSEKISTFNTDTYIFNGHGSALIKKADKSPVTFTVPEHTFYIMSTECGKKSFIASVDILTSARWRNAGLDQIPPSKEENEKVAAYKEELRQILGLNDTNDLQIYYPGDTPHDGTFIPLSNIGKINSNCKLDGYCGLIHRESLTSGDRTEKMKACERVALKNVEDLSCYYTFSVKPTKQEISDIQTKNDIEKAKLIAKTTYRFGELVNQFKGSAAKPAIFINPLCRVIEETEGGRRRTYRNKKLKRQTRRRRQ